MFCSRLIKGLVAPSLLVISFFAVPLPPLAFAASPDEALQSVIARAQKILNDNNLIASERDRMVREIAYPLFDFTETSRRAFAQNWPSNPRQQKELTELLTQILERRYFHHVKRLKDATISFRVPRIEKGTAQIYIDVNLQDGKQFLLMFKMRRTEGQWKIYDASIEGIGLISSYRAQLDRIMGKIPSDLPSEQRYNELIVRLKKTLA